MKIINSFNFFTTLLLGLSMPVAKSQIIINEIMQSNVSCLMDDLNDFPDSWIELCNTSSSDINLQGYAVGNKQGYNNAYMLPDCTIPARGYTIVYLDKVGDGMHADFRLDSGKGEIILFDDNENCVDYVSYKKMPSYDVSYGRLSTDSQKWGYQLTPTPGKANTTGVDTPIISATPIISVEGGMFDAPFDLTISMPNDKSIPDDATLALSTDGKWPTTSVGNEVTLTITSNTVVRACIISDSQINGPVITNSYIFHPEPTLLDVVSLVTDPDYLYDSSIGIFEGNEEKANDWRRPINIEYFGGNNHNRTINQLAETKVKGNWSRRYPQKSLALYANKRFGTKRFNTEGIWADKPNVTSVKSFELRNSGQRFIHEHLCDQFAHRIGGVGSKHLDWSAYRPVICYVNGEYHGIYDLRERCNEDNIEANYNGLEDIDMVTDWIELDVGAPSAVAELQHDFGGDDISFESLCESMDVDGFVEMFILQWVLGNTDFPHHNIVSWRYHTGDRRWRWMLKDLDCIGVDGTNGDYIYFVNVTMQNSLNTSFPQSGKAFNIFLNSEDGRRTLIPRLMAAMGDYLREDRALALFDEMAEEIAPEYSRHLQRFFPNSDKYTYEFWLNELEERKNEIRGRKDAIIKQLIAHYGYDKSFTLSINTNGLPVSIAGQELRHREFLGDWFYNQSLEIESTLTKEWIVKQTLFSGEIKTETIFADKLNLYIDSHDVKQVDILVNNNISYLTDAQFSTKEVYQIYNLTGSYIKSAENEDSCLYGLMPGIYICKFSNGSKKIFVK